MADRKAIIISNIPTHYKVDLFNSVCRIFGEKNVDFKVYFVAPTHKKRKNWSHTINSATFPWKYLDRRKLGSFDIIKGLGSLLDEERPDVVTISGNANLYALQISRACRARKIPYLFYSGIVSGKARAGNRERFPRLMQFVRYQWRKMLLMNSSGVIVHGKTHADYVDRLIHGKQIPVTVAYNTMDISRFYRHENAISSEFQDAFRPYEGDCNLFYCGQLIKLKGLPYLIEALSRIKDADYKLHMLGAGDQEAYIKELILSYGLEDRVIFWDEVKPENVASFYFMADIFVLPTLDDIWGLVINEAMAASLPVVSSKYAVAANELLVEGETGYIIDPRNIDDFSDKLRMLILDPGLREKIGNAAHEFAREHLAIDKTAGKVVRATLDLMEPGNH